MKGVFQVLVVGSAMMLSPVVAALAQEQVIEGRTKTVVVTRCRVKPATCEGSLTTEKRR